MTIAIPKPDQGPLVPQFNFGAPSHETTQDVVRQERHARLVTLHRAPDIQLEVQVASVMTDSSRWKNKESIKMLETIAIILVVLWLLGFVTSYTMGGLIHALLVIAIVVILIRVIQGRRV